MTCQTSALATASVLLIIFSLSCGASPWVRHPKIYDTDSPRAENRFGSSVAFSGGTILVGEPSFGRLDNGSALVYTVRHDNTWHTLYQRLGKADSRDRFGSAVALSSDTAAIAAPGDDKFGSVHVYTRDPNTTEWGFSQMLQASDRGRGLDTKFASSLALDLHFIAVGAPDDVNNDSQSGSVYVYETRNGSNFTEQPKLTASDGAAGDRFGFSVAISGSLLLIGAPSSSIQRGAAYVFVRESGGWQEQQKLQPRAPVTLQYHFGMAVAVSGNAAMVLAGSVGGIISVYTLDDQQQLVYTQNFTGSSSTPLKPPLVMGGVTAVARVQQGEDSSLRVFERVDRDGASSWSPVQVLVPEAHASSEFGKSVAVSDDDDSRVIVAGDMHDSRDASRGYLLRAGAAYIWSRDTSVISTTSQTTTATTTTSTTTDTTTSTSTSTSTPTHPDSPMWLPVLLVIPVILALVTYVVFRVRKKRRRRLTSQPPLTSTHLRRGGGLSRSGSRSKLSSRSRQPSGKSVHKRAHLHPPPPPPTDEPVYGSIHLRPSDSVSTPSDGAYGVLELRHSPKQRHYDNAAQFNKKDEYESTSVPLDGDVGVGAHHYDNVSSALCVGQDETQLPTYGVLELRRTQAQQADTYEATSAVLDDGRESHYDQVSMHIHYDAVDIPLAGESSGDEKQRVS